MRGVNNREVACCTDNVFSCHRKLPTLVAIMVNGMRKSVPIESDRSFGVLLGFQVLQ